MSGLSQERWRDAAWYAGLGALLLMSYALGGWGVVGAVVTIGPFLPVAALVPWYFVARQRGLAPRSARPLAVTLAEGALILEGLHRPRRVPLDAVRRARFVRNDNWTESKLLDDALTLLDGRGRVLGRVPLSAAGVEVLEGELRRRGVTVEERWVSAPTLLD